MERIVCNNASDMLIKALERADDMEDALVIYYAKEGCKGNYFCTEGMKAHDTLWLIEQFKAWLLGLAKRPESRADD